MFFNFSLSFNCAFFTDSLSLIFFSSSIFKFGFIFFISSSIFKSAFSSFFSSSSPFFSSSSRRFLSASSASRRFLSASFAIVSASAFESLLTLTIGLELVGAVYVLVISSIIILGATTGII